MNPLRLRRAVAGALLLWAVAGVALLAHAAELLGETRAGVTTGDAAGESAAIRRAASLADDGRPALLIVLSGSCGACEQASEDLRGGALRLEAAGVRVASIERDRLGAAGVRLPPGFFPAYLLFDAEGRILAVRRGYLPPERVLLWVRRELLSSPPVTASP